MLVTVLLQVCATARVQCGTCTTSTNLPSGSGTSINLAYVVCQCLCAQAVLSRHASRPLADT